MVCEPSFESPGAIQRSFCGATISEVVFEFEWGLPPFIRIDILPKLKLSDFYVLIRCRVSGDIAASVEKLIDELCLAKSC